MRLATKLCLLVVFGAVTSVGVAWGITMWGADLCAGQSSEAMVQLVWQRADLPGTATLYLESRPATGIVVIDMETHELELRHERASFPPRRCHPPGIRPNHRRESQVGWPMVCMWSCSDSHRRLGGGTRLMHSEVAHHVLRVWPFVGGTGVPATDSTSDAQFPWWNYSRFGSGPKVAWCVPTGILWRGMAGNTVVYAGAWWVVLASPCWIRRALRKQRHRCAACGYDRRGIGEAVCPECGVRPGS